MRVTHTANHLGNVTLQEMLVELVKTGSWGFSRHKNRGRNGNTMSQNLCKNMFLRECLQNIAKAIVKRDQLVLSKQLLVAVFEFGGRSPVHFSPTKLVSLPARMLDVNALQVVDFGEETH